MYLVIITFSGDAVVHTRRAHLMATRSRAGLLVGTWGGNRGVCMSIFRRLQSRVTWSPRVAHDRATVSSRVVLPLVVEVPCVPKGCVHTKMCPHTIYLGPSAGMRWESVGLGVSCVPVQERGASLVARKTNP